jgi:hypothetical protein
MADLRKGTYFDGQSEIECRIKKSGARTTRIVLSDGTEKLVPTSSLNIQTAVTSYDAPERLVPTIPLELFYRPLRKLKGTKKEQFQALCDSLNKRHGPKGSDFLVELFRRSVQHAQRYSNVGEPFYSARKDRVASKYPFAKELVKKLKSGTPITTTSSLSLGFGDYEIFPFRTTQSCSENGKPATSIGSGGMDLLLTSTTKGVLVPAMGEIKAATETVGPTFALVQSLMYTAQLVTCNQFVRLKKHYNNLFASIDEQHPRMDVIVLLQVDSKLNKEDLRYALSLAAEIKSPLSEYLRRIDFLWCDIGGDTVKCEPVTDN